MTKDHFVAQTYLRSFSVSGKPGFVNVVMKGGRRRVNATPVSVSSICYRVDWSTNEYFRENPRVIEDYLRPFEQNWSNWIKQLNADDFSEQVKWFVSGYVAYLRACTPTAVRIAKSGLTEILQHTYDIIEKREFSDPKSPHRKAIELIRKHGGGASVDVDQDYPKAFGIKSLERAQAKLFEFPWIIFKNETTSQLITSDNPVALHYVNGQPFCDFYCPITPEIAVLIHPTREPERNDYFYALKPEGVDMFNRLVVKCAEQRVIFGDATGVESLVDEYENWHVELITAKLPVEKGTILVHQQRPVKAESSVC